MTEPFDLSLATPAGRDTTSYAVELLISLHRAEVAAAEHWLLSHPDESVPALIEALSTPCAQAAAVLLGMLRAETAVEPLVAAHARGGEGLRSAAVEGLELIGTARAATALRAIQQESEG